jgi:hypothetical protein
MPIGKDQTGTADIQIALWDGLGRHGKPPESGATHVRASEQPKKTFHSLPRRVWVSFFFFLLQYSLDAMGVYDKG